MTDQAQPIEAEVVKTQAVALRAEPSGAVGRPLTIDELHANLEFVRAVMKKEMREGTDYGKIPGCGDKPALLQPGAQKLLLTFNLCERVKKEDVRDFPNGHREYAFTITVVAVNGKEWDGVGTCSTLEGKYRYRQQEIRCPQCGKPAVRKSKKEAGWYCWAKIGGCGANFPADASAIVSQPRGRVEHDNPADFWNTCRKMAFKRALVAGTINATNTSELWTQDIEDNAPEEPDPEPQAPATPAKPSGPPQDSPPPAKRPPAPASAQSAPIPYPTAESRTKMLKLLWAMPGDRNRAIVEEYFRKLENPSVLMPNESLEQISLDFVPATKGQMKALSEMITRFGNGDRAEHAFPRHPIQPVPGVKAAAQVAPKVAAEVKAKAVDPEWWRAVIIPVPRKGMKRDEYMKKPDTIGSLFDLRHGSDDESQAARQRLWGLIHNWDAKPREWKGHTYPPTDADLKCRDALDSFAAWFAQNHPDEKL